MQALIRSGTLKHARELLETLQGVLQQPPSTNASEAEHQAVARLSAHVGVLHVSLLQREGQLVAAGRMLVKVRELVESLPDGVRPSCATHHSRDVLRSRLVNRVPVRTASVLTSPHLIPKATRSSSTNSPCAPNGMWERFWIEFVSPTPP